MKIGQSSVKFSRITYSTLFESHHQHNYLWHEYCTPKLTKSTIQTWVTSIINKSIEHRKEFVASLYFHLIDWIDWIDDRNTLLRCYL